MKSTKMSIKLITLTITLVLIANTKILAQENIDISINHSGLYPEGISYDNKSASFYLSSVSKGQIIKVNKDGTHSIFINDSDLISTIGLKIDSKRNRLIVCNGDPGVGEKSSNKTKGQLAAIAIYNLKTGKREDYINLAKIAPIGGHIANDVTIDNNGNLFITDSFSPIIYKVDINGKASIFLTDQRFSAPAGNFGLNGLVYHPDGYLIVAKYNTGKLYKIPVSNPKTFQEILIKNKKHTTIDGVLLLDDKTIAIVSNNLTTKVVSSGVYKLATNTNWQSANTQSFFDTGKVFPTTLTKANDNVFVLYSNLHKLFGGNNPESQIFKIKKIVFNSTKKI